MRKNSTKRRADELLEAMKTAKADIAGSKAASPRDVLLLAVAFAEPVTTAFEKAGLNIENLGHWVKLAIYLSAAVYGKEAGQPTSWSFEKYGRLLNDIDEIKAAHPSDNELECCRKLLSRNSGTYNEVKRPQTLRRVLQNAKKWRMIEEKVPHLVSKGVGPLEILKASKKLRRQRAHYPRRSVG
jgi:hypothetical protein